jgi:hypothetical protein
MAPEREIMIAPFPLPPCIDDRATFTDVLRYQIRLRIDRFAYSSQQAQARQVVFGGPDVPTFENARIAVGAV